jgi:CRISPR-associated protein Csx17
MADERHSIELSGCAPIPLASYLKALGVLRLVSEQVDKEAQAWWNGDAFWLRSNLDPEGLIEFFLEKYEPTPIVVPWSGADFFQVNRTPDCAAFSQRWPAGASDQRPTANTIIESFLVANSRRLESYLMCLSVVFNAIDIVGLREKKDLEEKGNKRQLLLGMRSLASDELIPWIDAATLLGASDKPEFNNLLGGGGGSDGNSHFSDNFMQCLWCVLPDFDFQRKTPISAVGGTFRSNKAIEYSLFRTSSSESLLKKLSPALFNSQAIGGVNATSGFSADAASNPWDFILMMEGSLLFAGALSRKTGSAIPPEAAFPFLFRLSPTGAGTLVSAEATGRGKEAWLPLWNHAASLPEIRYLFAESRVLVGTRHAADGLDVARSLALLGVDRGIGEFQRIGLIRGRIGGDNYFTAADLGRYSPRRNEAGDILASLDGWLNRFRQTASSKKAPARAGRALRQLETAIFSLCQRGAKRHVQDVLSALGQAEAAVAASPKLRDAKDGVRPVPSLSSAWILHANDDSVEFRLAMALAGIGYRTDDKAGAFRRYIEPITPGTCFARRPQWSETADDPAMVWGRRSLVQNMLAVLNRRTIDAVRKGKRTGDDELLFPGKGRFVVNLGDIAAFIDGEVDDRRIESLLRGLILVNWLEPGMKEVVRRMQGAREPIPDGAYALLKLCHLPFKVANKAIPLSPTITRRAASGNLAEATRLAAQRLRGSGLPPAVKIIAGQGERARRTAAAILFPIAVWESRRLMNLVLQAERNESDEDTIQATDTTSETT